MNTNLFLIDSYISMKTEVISITKLSLLVRWWLTFFHSCVLSLCLALVHGNIHQHASYMKGAMTGCTGKFIYIYLSFYPLHINPKQSSLFIFTSLSYIILLFHLQHALKLFNLLGDCCLLDLANLLKYGSIICRVEVENSLVVLPVSSAHSLEHIQRSS